MSNKFRRAVRARMKKTGETYQAAFNALSASTPKAKLVDGRAESDDCVSPTRTEAADLERPDERDTIPPRLKFAADMQRRIDAVLGPRYKLAADMQRRIDTVLGPSHKLAVDMQRRIDRVLGPTHKLAADMQRTLDTVLGPSCKIAADMQRHIDTILGPLHKLTKDMHL